MSSLKTQRKPANDTHFFEKFDHSSTVELSLVLFMGIVVGFIILMIGLMVFIRWYYRKQLEIRIKELQEAYEPGRIFLIENAGKEVVQVRPSALSPPLSDQTEYNVVAGYLRDDKRGQLF